MRRHLHVAYKIDIAQRPIRPTSVRRPMKPDSTRKALDLTHLPREPWSRAAMLFTECASSVAAESVRWTEESYAQRDRLRALWQFLAWHLSDEVSGTIHTLVRVWHFPWTEAEAEAEMALAYAIAGLHRASIAVNS